jgi:hypothetical protein
VAIPRLRGGSGRGGEGSREAPGEGTPWRAAGGVGCRGRREVRAIEGGVRWRRGCREAKAAEGGIGR